VNGQPKQNGSKGAQIPIPPLARLISVLVIALILGTLGLLLVDKTIALSVFLGGLIFVIPYAFFVVRVFRFRGAGVAQNVAQGFYRGEAGKFVLTVMLFALVFALVRPLHALALFGGYIAMVLLGFGLAARLTK
jgi:ATP synthase protein I